MDFRYGGHLIECKTWNWRLMFLSKCASSWFGESVFPESCPNETPFFKLGFKKKIGIATAKHRVKKKKEAQKD